MCIFSKVISSLALLNMPMAANYIDPYNNFSPNKTRQRTSRHKWNMLEEEREQKEEDSFLKFLQDLGIEKKYKPTYKEHIPQNKKVQKSKKKRKGNFSIFIDILKEP